LMLLVHSSYHSCTLPVFSLDQCQPPLPWSSTIRCHHCAQHW
jgi:hypothetical protein